MSGRTDLTRWNRAGLKRFRYVDGNAATYLEQLRQSLTDRFPEWESLQVTVPGDESASRRLARLLEQYHHERADFGREIARALARACHVLTEHLDAYANEGYLGTATQWDNVRRLVEMLDYHPAPPASASTPLAIAAKEGPGILDRGFAVRHSPPDGGAPVIFETLEDLEVDPAMNTLRPAGWNRSPETFEVAAGPTWIAPEKSGISAGQLGIVVRDTGTPEVAVVEVDNVDEQTGALTFEDKGEDWRGWPKGDTRLLVKPGFIERPRLNGPDTVTFVEPHGLTPGEVVAWRDAEDDWVFDAVTEADELAVRLEGGDLPPVLAEVFRALVIERGADGLVFPESYRAAARRTDAGFTLLTDDDWDPLSDGGRQLKDDMYPDVASIFLVPQDVLAVAQVALLSRSESVFDGKPGKLASGQWVIADDGAGFWSLRIASITEAEDHYVVGFPLDAALPPRIVRLYGSFERTLRPEGYDRNPTPLAGSVITVAIEQLPRLLTPGRRLVIEREDRDGVRSDAFVTRVGLVEDPNAERRAIQVAPPIPDGKGFTIGNTVITANVVPSGHGEARPEKVMGSGDATRSGQHFLLKEAGISFVADPTQPSGVRADVEVNVDGRNWQQVANLRDSGPADPHYAVRMTEDGYLNIQFGDGRRGRRLPTGGNNVRVRFRMGAGLAGNLAAESLDKPVKPHNRVDSVRQPLAATGGNDMEPVESLRENAPASLLTLERAVSLVDFGLLAARQASVWQARAFALPTGPRRHESVEVVVVPAGGGALGDLETGLRLFLGAHALPGVEIKVSRAEMETFHVAVTARIKSAEYEPELVLEAIKAALLDAFSLRRRKLGQDLFLSEVYQVVEGVQGVENSLCVLDDDAAIRRREASEWQVFYVDSDVDLEWTEFEL